LLFVRTVARKAVLGKNGQYVLVIPNGGPGGIRLDGQN
jgi:hypothetical protein